MNAIDLMRNALEFTDRFVNPMIDDLRDIALIQPTQRGGNHALWIMGHLASSEAAMRSMVTGSPNPLEDWQAAFGPGTQPVADGSAYPSFDEVVRRFRESRAATMQLLESMSDADLDKKPKGIDHDMEHLFKTNADVLMLVLIHQQFHFGQLADVRRAAGRAPIFSPAPAETTLG